MFNPFVRFRLKLMEGFRQSGKQWLVAQSYYRCEEAERSGKQAILLMHYSDALLARQHLATLNRSKDRYACIIDLEKEAHRKTIENMIVPSSNYLVYATLIDSERELQRHLRRRFKVNIRRYLSGNTNWHIQSNNRVEIQLDIIFGILYILLIYKKEVIRVKLDEIEKY